MKTICAWCGDLLKDGDEPISHGICQMCAQHLTEPTPASVIRAKNESIVRRRAEEWLRDA